MNPPSPGAQDMECGPRASGPHSSLLLVGLGHAHLHVLESLVRKPWPAPPVRLVTPPEYDYSGMLSGVIAGSYAPEQARLSPERLSRAAGVEWLPGRVRRVDAAARRVVLDDGSALSYDLLSLDIGSRAAGMELPGVREHATPIKPVRNALRFRSEAESVAAGAPAGEPARIAIVGGGAAGVEIALCLSAALARRFQPGRYRLLLLEAGPRILEEYPETFRRRAAALLRGRGVELLTGVEVREVRAGQLWERSGEVVAFDTLLWATGPAAPRLFRRSGLPADEADFLSIGSDLRTVGYPEIFAAGDCATLREHPWVPKAGVYAVRQGPVLARNLRRALRSEPLERYTPQRHWLSLLNTGDGRALASYRGATYHGRLAWWLKDRIDRRFVERFQRLGSG